MKKLILPFLFLFMGHLALANCDAAYSQASYALAHAKKALEANNFDHQIYYAERSLEAFEKAQQLVSDCGCNISMDPILDGLENLKQAIDPADWETGRHFTKRAIANAQDLLAEMDRCTGGSSIMDSPQQVPDVNAGKEALAAEAQSIQQKQDQLKQEQMRLQEEQKKLEQKMEEQRQLAAKMKQMRADELVAQKNLKATMEQSLAELQKSSRAMVQSLGCDNSVSYPQVDFTHSDAKLQEESLETTKKFYLEKASEMHQQALDAISNCRANSGR